ncbi:MAG: hypothetical protein F4X58_00995 [Chloroflexi bacterium]|nr:hypothetical protein [Chloroflexota bacterium]
MLDQNLVHRVLTLYSALAAGDQNFAGGLTGLLVGNGYSREVFWEQVHKGMQIIAATGNFSNPYASTYEEDLLPFLYKGHTQPFLDFLEVSFKVESTWDVLHDGNEVIAVINDYLRLGDAPFQVTSRVVKREAIRQGGGPPSGPPETLAFPKVVRMDNEVVFDRAITPALEILADPRFSSANDEFRKALDRLRNKEYRESVTYCTSTCESVMKVLCKENGWAYNERDTISKLSNIVISHSSLAGSFTQQIGHIGTIRNAGGMAHGAGNQKKEVPFRVADYCLAATAAAVVLLVREAGATSAT